MASLPTPKENFDGFAALQFVGHVVHITFVSAFRRKYHHIEFLAQKFCVIVYDIYHTVYHREVTVDEQRYSRFVLHVALLSKKELSLFNHYSIVGC